jgi:hypothetical protein
MMKVDIKKKLLSRKFWAMVLTNVAGIIVALGAPEKVVNLAIGCAMSLVSTVIYVIVEGRIDEASVSSALTTAKDIVEEVKK